jgi:hypothetical protein
MHTRNDMLCSLVDDLSSPDSSVRDGRALTGLTEALLSDSPIDDDEARGLYEYAVRPAGPLQTIGDPEGSPTAFGRSFGLELLALLHHRHNQRAFLSEDDRTHILGIIEGIGRGEQDFRGHLAVEGWVHVVAHAADLMDEYLDAPGTTPDEAQRVIDALASLVERSPRTFVDGEEDRVAIVLAGAQQRGQLDVSALEQLVLKHADDHPSAPARRNWTNVIRSLYFRAAGGSAAAAPAWQLRCEGELTGL